MPKISLDKLMKPGAKMKFANVDYSTEEKQKELAELKKKQQEILKQAEVDWQELNKFVIKL